MYIYIIIYSFDSGEKDGSGLGGCRGGVEEEEKWIWKNYFLCGC